MNHFPFHIGDWMKDTAHLSAVEEGVYLRLMIQCYNREAALPLDMAACVKLARATTKEEREAVRSCLAEFFTKTADGYRQKRCDEEIAAYQERAQQAREAGRKGGRPPNSVRNVPHGPEPQRLFPETATVPTENRDGSPQEPGRFPTETQTKASRKPITNNQEKKADLSGRPDFDRWYAAYPRREARGKAESAFVRALGTGVSVEQLVAAVENQKLRGCLRPAQADGRSLIPLPASWLNARRWTDEVGEGAGESASTGAHERREFF